MPAVIVLELIDPQDLERACQILRVIRLPEYRGYLAVQDSAEDVLAVFKSAQPHADAQRLETPDA